MHLAGIDFWAMVYFEECPGAQPETERHDSGLKKERCPPICAAASFASFG